MKQALLPLMLIASSLSANEYQDFIDFTYIETSTRFVDYEMSAVSWQHFFSEKTAIGPLSEFEFINHNSSFSAGYVEQSGSDFLRLGGEYIDNNIKVGGHYSYTQRVDYVGTVQLGYFVNPDLLIQVVGNKTKDADETYSFNAQYNHQLSEGNYLGFSLLVNEDTDYRSYSATYFTALSEGTYIKSVLSIHDSKFDDAWGLNTSYFFNTQTSLSFNYGEDDFYSLGAQHFFTQNIAVFASYSSVEGYYSDIESAQIGLKVQL